MKRIRPKSSNLGEIDYQKVFFIEANSEGEIYTNQTGGTACNHPSLKGNLYHVATFPKGKRPPMFNPDWWGNLFYRDWGVLEDKYVNKGLLDYPAGANYDEILSKWERDEAKIALHPKIISHSKLSEMFEIALQKILPKKFFDCEVIHPFHNVDSHGFRVGEQSEEAWVFVRLYYKTKEQKWLIDLGYDKEKTAYKEGVITWRNCD